MRLACYGWVMEDGGSVSSANHVLLRELLRRGHTIELFANAEHVPSPPGLENVEGFSYVGFTPPAFSRPPRAVSQLAELGFGPYWKAAWRRRYEQEARARHARTPYDALLTVGVAPAFAVRGIPTVTWLQGPQHTELEAIHRLRPLISRVSGRPFYLALSTYYWLRNHRERHALDECDEVVCGSKWAKRALVEWGFPADRLHAIPYPIDLVRFSPAGQASPDLSRPLLLSLGRLDPRKRIDLLVAAFDIVARTRPGARLQVVGRTGYAPRQAALLEQSAFRNSIDYRPYVARASVPDVIRAADVVVQPSENENFGSAVAEALACGVPVVVGHSNGTGDYVDAGSEIFSSYTPTAVADAVLRVLDRRHRDPGAAARSARASAERWFSAVTVVDALEAVLARAVAAGRPAHPRG